MLTIPPGKGDENLSYAVRLMRQEDVAQVTEIDHEAFPTQLPAPNYQHELRNQLAHYLVAYDDEQAVDRAGTQSPQAKNSTGIAARWKQWFKLNPSLTNATSSDGQYILGFVGYWIIADEAHIMAIAVREAYRQRGIGELLLLSAIDQATELKAHTVTLEVRVSNTSAQSLYTKYRFSQTGLRRGYYTDNREDGIVMTTPDITLPECRTYFQQLKQTHSSKWGIAFYQISR